MPENVAVTDNLFDASCQEVRWVNKTFNLVEKWPKTDDWIVEPGYWSLDIYIYIAIYMYSYIYVYIYVYICVCVLFVYYLTVVHQ